jgi:transcription initiation factor TFIID subunit 1
VAEQQQVYKSEIERIWKLQHDSLSRKDEPQLDPEDDEKKIVRKPSLAPVRQNSVGELMMNSPSAFSPPGGGPSAVASPAYSRGSSIDRDRESSMGPDASRKVLRIKRYVCCLQCRVSV